MYTIRFDKLELHHNDFVLDMGCGEGRHSIGLFIDHQVNTVAFDLSLKDLNTARKRLKDFPIHETNRANCFFGVGDVHSLPFKDNFYSSVICSEVLEHIQNPEDAIDELVRVLKPGGVLALSVPRFLPEWICWKLSQEYSRSPGGHVRIFKHKQLKELALKRGLLFEYSHWAHALHSPYWWLKCIFWEKRDEPWVLKKYHKFLVWDLMKKPLLTKFLEWVFQPLIGKSLVMYFIKPL